MSSNIGGRSRGRNRGNPASAPAPLTASLSARWELRSIHFDPAAIEDRPAAFRRLHADPGVHPIGRKTFALAGYADVRAAARSHEALVSGQRVTGLGLSLPMLLTLDEPHHGELRRLLTPLFTARRLAGLEPMMRRLTRSAIERMLAHPRWGSPVQQLCRTGARDYTVGVGFGSGIHHCLGARLARLEVRIVLEELLPRVQRIQTVGPVIWRDNPTVYGPEHLCLRLDPS